MRSTKNPVKRFKRQENICITNNSQLKWKWLHYYQSRFQSKGYYEGERDHFIKIKESIYQDEIIIPNV